MRMKSRLPCVPIVMAVMSALAVTAAATIRRTTTWPTTETPGQSLNGKMLTLSRNGGRISFFPPYYSPTTPNPWATRPYYTTTKPTTTTPTTTTKPTTTKPTTTTPTTTTKPTTTTPWTTTPTTTTKPTTTTPWTTTPTTTRPTTTHPTTTRPTTRPTTTRPTTTRTTTTRPTTTRTTTTRPTTTRPTTPWTTAPATRGVSVCLRYLADDLPSLFTLSPSSSPLQLNAGNVGSYSLTFPSYVSMYFRPNLRFWSNIGPDIWTRVCLTVDSMNNVVQMFSGPNISIRKRLNYRYVWSGEPVIEFSGFDGQLTDVQIWDYPLRYKEVFNYMTSGVYAPYRGSALSWSDISYSPRGQSLLEDTYEWQARQPIGSSRVKKGRRPKGGKKTWAFSNMEGQRERL